MLGENINNTDERFLITVQMLTLHKSMALRLDCTEKTATLNGEKIVIADFEGFVSGLLAIVALWDNEMINLHIVDGVQYGVCIEKNGKESRYRGSNKFPPNFKEFLALLRSNNMW